MYIIMMATSLAQVQDRNILPGLKKGVGRASNPFPPQQHRLTTTHHTLFVSSV